MVDDEDHGPEAWTSHCGPYFTEVLVVDEHIATHFDAPGHSVREHAPGQAVPLANLAEVPPGAWFRFLPIKVARSSGGPGRAVARVPA